MTTSSVGRTRGSLLGWLAAIMAACFLFALIGAYNLVTLTRDAAALRRAIVAVDGIEPHLRIQGSIGPALIASVRAGLHLIDDVPPEAHRALAAARGASVAVYELDAPAGDATRSEIVRAASAAMRERGWTRAVTVRDAGETVLIFTPHAEKPARRVRVCLAVCSGRNLVIVEARLSRDGLAELVAEHCPPLEI